MTPHLLKYLCEPITKANLTLVDPILDKNQNILSGILISPVGKRYPIINGIPRFIEHSLQKSVESFGDEWNYYNFVDHKVNWLRHTVENTFGSTKIFAGKLIVDAGGGSGAQTKWFVEYGARHVILLDLAHSIDGVVQHNLVGLENVDVVQCSIDSPPLRDESINGIVYCHNVIQHTPSVGKTAQALFDLTAPGGEFVFNCYQLNDQGLLRWIRWHLIYKPLRAFLSHMPFWFILSYAKIMASLRLVPVLGELLEKMLLVGQGDVPIIQGESIFSRLKRRFKAASLNTFDAYGAHKYQHHKKDEEIQKLLNELQPDPFKIMNRERYFLHPTPIGCALRVFK